MAHPDDIESWCAGAVNALIWQGWRADYILCTSGEKGTSDAAAVALSWHRAEETGRAGGLALAEAFKRLRL